MKCLIVAAGQGTRLREKGDLKPLIPVRGVPLIERVIRNGRAAGIEEFLVVTGYRGAELQAELRAIASRVNVSIGSVENAEWRQANGVSVLAARSFLTEPFLLAMCDHLVEPEILRLMAALPADTGAVTLGVDHDIEDPLNDLDDVTKVLAQGDRLVRIGKTIADYNCFDIGVFHCAPVMFDALAESRRRGDDSISGGMTVLAERGQARVFDIGGRVWLDVDDPVGFAKAEALLDSGRL